MSDTADTAGRWVEIEFDCVPLRSIGRLDIPLDASPKFRERCKRIKAAIDQHGSFNTYYLYNARCTFHLTNHPDKGLLEFQFRGTVFTDNEDQQTEQALLEIELRHETCDWLTPPVTEWFAETVRHAVCAEFDRYIAAGDLEQTRLRIEKLQAECDEAGGFLGMYL